MRHSTSSLATAEAEEVALDQVAAPVGSPAPRVRLRIVLAGDVVFTLLYSILFAHLLDASSTFIGVDYLDYIEKHVVPTFFIDLAGRYTDHPSIVMYPLKLLVFIPVLYMLDRQFDVDKEKRLIGLMKLAILVLGLSPAVRNILRLLVGV